jgi:hypothetical protein
MEARQDKTTTRQQIKTLPLPPILGHKFQGSLNLEKIISEFNNTPDRYS